MDERLGNGDQVRKLIILEKNSTTRFKNIWENDALLFT